jgi:uncharacterized protein YbjT (DUF2867 family)
MDRETVLVLGGTGHYGRHIVESIAHKDVAVRVMTRNAQHARTVLPASVELVEGDIESPEDIQRALAEVTRMVVAISAFTPRQIRRVKEIEQDAVIAALDAARATGVERVVYISVFDVKEDVAAKHRIAQGDIKLAVERHLAQSDFNWTVIGAPPSMDIFFAMTRGGQMTVPGGGPPAFPTISPVDLGEVAAQAVLRDDLSGRRIRAAGPETVSFPEAAAAISRAWGRPIKFMAIPLVLPTIGYYVTGVLAPLSDRLFYVHTLLGFVRLLNDFPVEVARQAVEDHKELVRVFEFTPTTIEMEARRRGGGS